MSRVWKFWSVLADGWEQAGRVLNGGRYPLYGLPDSRYYVLWLIFIYLLTMVRKLYRRFQPLYTRIQSIYHRCKVVSSTFNFICQKTDICNCCERRCRNSLRNQETQTDSRITESRIDSSKASSPRTIPALTAVSSRVSPVEVFPNKASTSRILDAAESSNWNAPTGFKELSPEAKPRSKLDKFRDAIDSEGKKIGAASVPDEIPTENTPSISERSSSSKSETALRNKVAICDSNLVVLAEHSNNLHRHSQSWNKVLRLRFNRQENRGGSGPSQVLTRASGPQFTLTQLADVIEIHPITGMNHGYRWHLSLQLAFEREYMPAPVASYRRASPFAFLMWIFQRLGLVQQSESEFSIGQPASRDADCLLLTGAGPGSSAEIVIREPVPGHDGATIAINYETDAYCQPVQELCRAEQDYVPSSCVSESVECKEKVEPCNEATQGDTNGPSLELSTSPTISCKFGDVEFVRVIEQACDETDRENILDEPTCQQDISATTIESDACIPVTRLEPTDGAAEIVLQEPISEQEQGATIITSQETDAYCQPVQVLCRAEQDYVPSSWVSESVECKEKEPCNEATQGDTNGPSLELGTSPTISCESGDAERMRVIEQACDETDRESILDESKYLQDTSATTIELHACNPVTPEPELDTRCKPTNSCAATEQTVVLFDLLSVQEDSAPSSCESESPECKRETNLEPCSEAERVPRDSFEQVDMTESRNAELMLIMKQEPCNEAERNVLHESPSEQGVDTSICGSRVAESMPITKQEPFIEAEKAVAPDECSSEQDSAPKTSNTKTRKRKPRKRNKDQRK